MSAVDNYVEQNAQVHQFAAEVAKNHIRYPTDARVFIREHDGSRCKSTDRTSCNIN